MPRVDSPGGPMVDTGLMPRVDRPGGPMVDTGLMPRVDRPGGPMVDTGLMPEVDSPNGSMLQYASTTRSATMVDPTLDYYFVTTDEVGNRIAGYTVRGANGTSLCKTMDDVEKVVGSPEKFVWASLDDARVHYTRQPGENWGFATESITVRHYDSESRKIVESEVKRDSVPFDRYDFADY